MLSSHLFSFGSVFGHLNSLNPKRDVAWVCGSPKLEFSLNQGSSHASKSPGYPESTVCLSIDLMFSVPSAAVRRGSARTVLTDGHRLE